MTISNSQLNNMTVEEVINYLDDKRHHSPIINILINHIELLLPNKETANNNRTDCPVCLAQLVVEVDEDNDFYQLKVNV